MNTIEEAKQALAQGHPLSAWSKEDSRSLNVEASDSSVRISRSGDEKVLVFQDNAERLDCASIKSEWGDDLPIVPVVLTGCCESWLAMNWSLPSLAARLQTSNLFSLDGGPGFARMSLAEARVSMHEYLRYTENDAKTDVSPLYIFDYKIFKNNITFDDGGKACDEFSVPLCFSRDMLSGCTGSSFRPLPPAWLLVGAPNSGTPIHDHPLTIAWNALLDGCKLWAILPPDCDEKYLLLNDDNDEGLDGEFDLSALEWFCQSDSIPSGGKIIVQKPGEVVFVPAGWFHVVLNVKTSVAISHSIAIRRDLSSVFPALLSSDEAFALFWLERLPDMSDTERASLLERASIQIGSSACK